MEPSVFPLFKKQINGKNSSVSLHTFYLEVMYCRSWSSSPVFNVLWPVVCVEYSTRRLSWYCNKPRQRVYHVSGRTRFKHARRIFLSFFIYLFIYFFSILVAIDQWIILTRQAEVNSWRMSWHAMRAASWVVASQTGGCLRFVNGRCHFSDTFLKVSLNYFVVESICHHPRSNPASLAC